VLGSIENAATLFELWQATKRKFLLPLASKYHGPVQGPVGTSAGPADSRPVAGSILKIEMLLASKLAANANRALVVVVVGWGADVEL